MDTFFTLKAFQTDQQLTFPLLSDFNKQVIRDYGVFNEDMIGLKGIAKRAVFVLDKDGVVRHREVLEDARNEPDYGKVSRAAVVGASSELSFDVILSEHMSICSYMHLKLDCLARSGRPRSPRPSRSSATPPASASSTPSRDPSSASATSPRSSA